MSDPAAVPLEIYGKVVAEGLKSACLIPLVNRGRVLGGLVIARKTETPFTPEDVEFLNQAAGQIAIAIENALTVGTFEVKGSHAAYVSQPEAVADLIARAADGQEN